MFGAVLCDYWPWAPETLATTLSTLKKNLRTHIIQNSIKCGASLQAHERMFAFLVMLAQCRLCHICTSFCLGTERDR
jgi:hypothetical protein